MKFLPLLSGLCLILFSITLTSAQTEKGRLTVGAQIGTSSYQNQNGNLNVSANMTPSAGYFIADGLVIGTGVPLSGFVQKSTAGNNTYYEYKYTGSTIGLSPFVRYFIGKSKLKPYLGLAYSYSKTTVKTKRNDNFGEYESNGKGKITAFVPTVGLAYFISQNLGLTLSLNYNINHQDQKTFDITPYSPTPTVNDSNTKSLSLGIGFQLFIGK